MSLSGRHAVVTGGSRGIGLAIASLLAEHGARISIVSRTSGTPADITDEEQVRRAFAACREANGPIEILVNNSGIAESAPLKRTDRAMWDRIIATNLTGTFLCTREAIPDMIAAGWGRIVNMASTAGLGGAPYLSAYCASKHGVVGFTRAVAAELAKNGITVNAICPGYTETDMMQRTLANITARTQKSESEARELLALSNPGGRIATVEEVALEVLELIEGEQTGTAVVIPREQSKVEN
ncbi:MAG TPA: SDR family oxidoreductase [Candidatus Cybelea sp.]|nr:SDR family oxidoreductase [Candidatus Cybelea sp.]